MLPTNVCLCSVRTTFDCCYFHSSVASLLATTGASPKVMTAKKLTLKELETCAAESGRKLLRTFPEMRLAFLHECGKRRLNRAYALRDYYPFWKTNAERSKAGKLLLLNRRDEEHIQIMFDDNIGYGSPHIVDARDSITGQPVSFQVNIKSHRNAACMAIYCFPPPPSPASSRMSCCNQQQ